MLHVHSLSYYAWILHILKNTQWMVATFALYLDGQQTLHFLRSPCQQFVRPMFPRSERSLLSLAIASLSTKAIFSCLPCAAAWSGVMLPFPVMLAIFCVSAPLSISTFTVPTWPCRAALHNGVQPWASAVSGWAPKCN